MSYPCTCRYVPDYVLEALARHNVQHARDSLIISDQLRETRSEKEIPLEMLMSPAPQQDFGAPKRLVYDSGHERKQRVELARGEGDPATGDEDVRNAYDYAGQVRDYFMNALGRDSIDNANMELVFNVHYGEKYLNAFWDGDEMTFGDGDGEIFTSFAKSLDVVAHELAHGVTQFTANLEYRGQSGAMNEHFSDVFGTAITQHALGQTADDADWLVGDEIMGPTLFGEALRSMKAPGTAYDNELLGRDPQPAHMRDLYTGQRDNGGVHINSGIFNRVFYLVSMEIGTGKAAQIWYHALQNLWPKAQFNDGVEVIVNAARILTKDMVAPRGAPQTIRAAFREVGLPVIGE